MSAPVRDPARFDGLPRMPAQGRPLTRRQVDIVLGVAEGLTDAQVATRLGLTEGSVRVMLRRARAKLGASNRAHVVYLAYRAGVIV